MNIKRKLFWDLIIRYIMFLFASVAVTALFIGLMIVSLVQVMEKYPDAVADLNIYFNNIEYDGRTAELRLPTEIEPDAWVEILKDNQVVHVEGNKLDEKYAYSQDDLARIANNVDQISSAEKFVYEYIPFTGADGENYTLLYKRAKISSGVFRFGTAFPDSVKGTEFERELSGRIRAYFAAFASLVILLIVLFSRTTFRKIMTPLKEINRGLKRIMTGDYSTRMDFTGNSEFEEIRDAFNVMAGRLAAAEEENRAIAQSKKRMLLDISHDLRTPVTTIQGYAEALRNGLVENEEQKKKYLNYIFEKSKVVTNLVDRLFKYSKLETSVYDLNRKTADLAEFMRNVVISFYGELESKGFGLDIQIPERKVLFSFDSTELERALNNIIGNIIRYNPARTTLSVELNEKDDIIQLIVGDDGVGISEDISGIVFNALVRGDNARKTDGGTGLGLAIAKKIIELHGGSIRLETSPGCGTRFIITFRMHGEHKDRQIEGE